MQKEVWVPGNYTQQVRDPAMYNYSGAWTILSGTGGRKIVEYPNLQNMIPSQGTSYPLRMYVPNGRDLIHSGYGPYDINFHKWGNTIYMYCSLQHSDDYTQAPSGTEVRDIFVLQPRSYTDYTPGGFPLKWKMANDIPLVPNFYAGRPFADGGTTYFLADNLACWCAQMSSPTSINMDTAHLLMDTGPWMGFYWDTAHPYPSEPHDVEGHWVHKVGSYYYLHYSDSDCNSECNYGGTCGRCTDLNSTLTTRKKIVGNNVKRSVEGCTDTHYVIGRPLPLVVNGSLHNIFYHARNRLTGRDEILRLTENPPLGNNIYNEWWA